jgi:hypothetical protein
MSYVGDGGMIFSNRRHLRGENIEHWKISWKASKNSNFINLSSSIFEIVLEILLY